MSRIIDEHFKKAEMEGQFENLPGKGKPLPPDPFAGLPEEIRNTYRILKNSGFNPAEVEKNKEIGKLKEKLKSLSPESEAAKKIRRKISIRQIEFAMATERLTRLGNTR